MSRWLRRLYNAGGDTGAAGGDGGGSSEGGTPETKEEKPAEGKTAPDPEKYVPLDKHKRTSDRLTAAEAELKKYKDAEADREKAAMTEQERLQKERDEFAGKATALEIKDAKREALDEALEKIGDGFTIPSDVMQKLRNSVQKLSYNAESIKADVAEIVEGMKKPKGSAGSVIKNAPKDNGQIVDMKDFRAPSVGEAFAAP